MFCGKSFPFSSKIVKICRIMTFLWDYLYFPVTALIFVCPINSNALNPRLKVLTWHKAQIHRAYENISKWHVLCQFLLVFFIVSWDKLSLYDQMVKFRIGTVNIYLSMLPFICLTSTIYMACLCILMMYARYKRNKYFIVILLGSVRKKRIIVNDLVYCRTSYDICLNFWNMGIKCI